jgi:DHA1 family multidrug resistance protein-like MFS transporter
MHENRTSITIYLAVTFLFWIALYLYVPSLPTYVKTKTSNLATVGLVLSMYGLFMAFVRLPMGVAEDAIGWGKPAVALGIFFAASGAFIMGRGDTLAWLAVGRAFTGLSAGTWVLLIGVFSTFFEFEQAVYASSLLTFSASFGRVVATSLNGFLNKAGGYRLAFYCAAAVGVLAILLVMLAPERKRERREVSLRSIALLFIRRDVLLPTVISAIVHNADWSVTFGFLPILAQQMGMGTVMKSLLISFNIAGIAAANLFNTLVLRRVGHGRLLSSGAVLFLLGMIAIALAPSVAYLFAGTVCMGFAFGVVYPVLMGMSIRNVEISERTTAMGIHQSLYAVGMFTGPWVSGMLADRLGIRNTFMITAGFYALAVFAFIALLRRAAEKPRG